MPLIRGIIATLLASAAFSVGAQTPGANAPSSSRPVLTNGGPVTTQTPPVASRPSAAAPIVPAPPVQVDESALRYFAAQGDTRRVDAEIARLRALYPNWAPPNDLSQLTSPTGPAPDPEIDRMWALYAAGQIAEVRAAVAQRAASDPQWSPPSELTTALDGAEARLRLVNASDSGQWRTVLSIATDTPTLLTCANVDALWRVAEAFGKTEQQTRAKDVYSYVLTNCLNPAERLGTLQKALSVLPDAQIAELLKYERKTGTTPDDFSAVRDELARRRVEKASTDPKLTASPDDLAIVERLAEKDDGAGNALLMGWYNYHHAQPQKAQGWFKTALERNGGAKAAEGMALTLRALEKFIDADAIAYEWRDKTPENLSVYLDIVTALLSQDPPLRVDPTVIARAIPVITQKKFSNGGQALGWYSYNTGQFGTAREWFQRALTWKPDDEPSAYGLALSSQRLNDKAGLARIGAAWRGRSNRIADLVSGRATTARIPGETAPDLTERGPTGSLRAAAQEEPPPTRTRQTTADTQAWDREVLSPRRPPSSGPSKRTGRCDGTANPHTAAPASAMALGWCLMDLNRPLEAVTAFDEAIRRGDGRVKQDAAYGKSLAYLRKDLTAQAAIAATEAPQDPKRQAELSATILAQRAVAAYRAGRSVEVLLTLSERARIVPEQNDLMLLRGWSYYKLGRYNDAEQVFRAVKRTGFSEDADIGLNAVLEATRPSRQY